MKIALCLLLFATIAYAQEDQLPNTIVPPENLPPERPRITYQPKWESLDSRPLPNWYDTGKIGIIVHWGIYSVPGVGSEWFWWAWQGEQKPPYVQYMRDNYKPTKTYASFVNGLTGSFYNAAKWAELFEHAGARYAIISAKHLDGYCMWPSPYSHTWNSLTSGPARDVVGDFVFGMRQNSGMKVGVQYSLYEWYNPIYALDKNSNFTTSFYPATKSIPELKDLVERYTPDVLWLSGDWDAPDTYWNSTDFLAWLYNESPVRDKVVVNDRWGKGTSCKHGGYLNCVDKFNPRVLQPRKWENVITMDKFSWGHRRNAHAWDFLEPKDLVRTLAETVSCGGNLLINVGATAQGMINPIYEDRLLKFGNWLETNGEAIYSTAPWKFQNDTKAPDVWYTHRLTEENDGFVYAIFLKYPTGDLVLDVPKPSRGTQVVLLGFGEVRWKPTENGMGIELPPQQAITAFLPLGWVLRISKLTNLK